MQFQLEVVKAKDLVAAEKLRGTKIAILNLPDQAILNFVNKYHYVLRNETDIPTEMGKKWQRYNSMLNVTKGPITRVLKVDHSLLIVKHFLGDSKTLVCQTLIISNASTISTAIAKLWGFLEIGIKVEPTYLVALPEPVRDRACVKVNREIFFRIERLKT